MAEKEPHEVLTDEQFRQHLTEVLPQLRAFSRSLTGSQPEFADDLVQDALLRAWSARASFKAGTNFRAWIFVILRNLFLSEMRRSKFKGEWNEIAAEKLLVSPVHQERHIELDDMQRALAILGLCSITPISPKTSFSPTLKLGSFVSFVGKKMPTSPDISKKISLPLSPALKIY